MGVDVHVCACMYVGRRYMFKGYARDNLADKEEKGECASRLCLLSVGRVRKGNGSMYLGEVFRYYPAHSDRAHCHCYDHP